MVEVKKDVKSAVKTASKIAAEAMKPAEEKAAVKKPAAKPAVKKEAPAKKAVSEKTAAPAKAAAKKAEEPKASVHFQFEGRDIVAKDVLDEAAKAFKSAHAEVEIKEIQLYIVAEEGAAYYVVNGEASDDYKIML